MSETKTTHLMVDISKEQSWSVIGPNGNGILNDYSVLLGRSRSPHISLEKFEDLSKTEKIKIDLKLGNKIVPVELPLDMMKRLAKYLANKKYPFNSEYDCLSFVHWMMGEQYTFKSGIDLSKYKMEKVELSNLKPGDIAYFVVGDSFSYIDARHAVVYIGNDLFLSKLGTWKLSIQNANQIKSIYGECNLFKQSRRT